MITSLDSLFYVALPYMAVATFLAGTIQRYRYRPFTYSSLSTQFFENKAHFWAMTPFHYGIILVLTAHFLAFLLPGAFLAWNAVPIRLYALEVVGLALGVMTLIGFAAVVVRRLANSKVRAVTTAMDWVVYAVLMFQIVTGVIVAVVHPWGSSWFAAAMSPYLWSLATFRPDVSYVAALPWLVRLHLINGSVFFLVFPFSRLVHLLVAPFPYLWRRPQVVRWTSPNPAGAK